MESALKQDIFPWITETFKERNFKTIDIEFPNYDTRGGSLGDIIFVDVIGRFDDHEDIVHVLIKRSKSDPIVLDEINLREAYQNEINLFTKILPSLQKFAEQKRVPYFRNIPKCFGTIVKENLYAILLENLKPKNFVMHGLETPQNTACAKLVLEAYAKWQALCLAFKDQAAEVFQNLMANNKDFQKKKLLKLAMASSRKELEFVIELYRKKNNQEMIQRIENYKDKLEDHYVKTVAPENCKFSVIRHGDNWNNNYLFKYGSDALDPEEVIIVDWQNSCLGPPLADVTHYLLSCCSVREYERIEDLLKFYHEILSKSLADMGSNPEKCFSWEECWVDFKKCLPPAIFMKPMFVRASLATGFNTSFDISQTTDDGDCHGMFSDGLKDPDEYFKRIDDTFRVFIEKGLI